MVKSEQPFEIIAPEDIRAEKMSFKDMIIRCMDRIHTVAAQMVEKNTRAGMAAYEESIAALHCYLSGYYGKEYEKLTAVIEDELYSERQFKDVERIALLREWLKQVTRQLGKVGLLPPIDVSYDMSTPEQRDEEEKEEFLRVMRKLVNKGRKDEVKAWLKLDGVLPKKKVHIRRPHISEILDKAYLQGWEGEPDGKL